MTRNTENETVIGEQGKRMQDKLLLEGHLLFGFTAMIFALLLMCPLPNGGRHLVAFTVAGIFAMVILVDDKFFIKMILTAVLFGYLYIGKIHYEVPFVQPEQAAAVNEWRGVLTARLVLDTQNPPGYENVVIWTLGDMVDDQPVATSWQLLYALPKGFGISCCTYDYVTDNFDSLQSRYIYVVQGGTIEEKCIQIGSTKIMEGNGMALYQLKPIRDPYFRDAADLYVWR